ncbi:hypothetical protein BGX34_002289, partial [Mortierella sp. NVP85]
MPSLLIPSSEATLRLEQAFQLIFQTSPPRYAQLCRAFLPVGGLPRAWLVKGESGSGKSYLVNALCKKYGVQYTATITIGDLAVMYPGDLLKGLKSYLASIKPHASAVVVLDNVELLFPREDCDSALVYAFQAWMQDLADLHNSFSLDDTSITSSAIATTAPRPRVMVLGLTQDARALDPGVASLFDDTIELDIPTPEERYFILKACTANHGITLPHQRQDATRDPSSLGAQSIPMPTEKDPLETISIKCHGYLAADLDALCRQAAIIANRDDRRMDQLTLEDFEEAMQSIKISALRQSTSVQKADPIRWSDIGGLETVK